MCPKNPDSVWMKRSISSCTCFLLDKVIVIVGGIVVFMAKWYNNIEVKQL